MPKLIALDIGAKRTGIAESDEAQIFASPLKTVATSDLLAELKELLSQQPVAGLVIGDPKDLRGADSDNSALVRVWRDQLKKAFQELPQFMVDERFTSKMAARSLVQSGVKKNKRRQKGALDQISAAIILQDFLDHR